MTPPVPIDTPSRTVLHYRNRTAVALLNHRTPTRATATLVRLVLDGRFDVHMGLTAPLEGGQSTELPRGVRFAGTSTEVPEGLQSCATEFPQGIQSQDATVSTPGPVHRG
jgi:hypothetical protein